MLRHDDTDEMFPADEAADIVRVLLDIADRYDLESSALSQEEIDVIRQAELLLEWLEEEDEA